MPNALRTATPCGDWRSFKFVVESPAAGVLGIKDAQAAGVPYLYRVMDTVGAVLESADVGEEAVLIYHAEKIMVTKATAQADIFYPGDRVYWVPTRALSRPSMAPGISGSALRLKVLSLPTNSSRSTSAAIRLRPRPCCKGE